MKGLAPLFLGIFGTFAFSWLGLTVVPNWQIGHLDPQSDEEGTDIYPQPQSGMFERGAHVYAANGCIYCHSQQVRADYAAADIERKWGNRRSAPRDYIFEQPVSLGKMRMGQDIANIGARAPAEQASPSPAGAAAPSASPSGGTSPAASAAPQGGAPAAGSPSPPSSPAQQGAAVSSPPSPAPAAVAASASPAVSPSLAAGAPWPVQTAGEPPMYSAAWHHVHLYSPRSINVDSNMPSYRFLYEKHRIRDARSADALQLTGSDAPPQGWEIVPSFDAKCLVAYLVSLNQSHPLKEVRSVGGAPAAPAPPAGSPPASPAPSK
ncbi:MAG TPA: cbb3-type cytochrome c oxidase subunit II [Candidatus Udaeobacter sp.]|nr:cbb3-type cytochrome c oxidase subunit II [Candidatus Udaeobacter sp.]